MTESTPPVRSSTEISDWLTDRLITQLDVPAADIKPDEPLTVLGLDSMQYIGLVGDLEDWLDCRFTDNPLIDYPTIQGLSEFVASQLQQGRSEIDPLAESP